MTPDELAYDLRQKYAEIVGMHLEAVSNARINKNYPEYFQSLENLFTVVKHKFKTKKKTDKEEEEEIYREEEEVKEENKKNVNKKKTDLERYYSIRQVAINNANEYKTTFLGQSDKPGEVSKVENSLREIEQFLFYIMDKSKMFGSTGYNEGM